MKTPIVAILMIIALSSALEAQKMPKVLVVAGGHRFDTTMFFSLFSNRTDLIIDTAMQPHANRIISEGKALKYDAIVFYDSWKVIDDKTISGYEQLLKRGVGMVFMHHALVSYQQWPGFINIIGGKYRKPRFEGDTVNLSTYKHDIDMVVEIVDTKHPVTKGLQLFEIHDEGYMNFTLLSTVKPLLTTLHPYSDPIIGWHHKVKKSRVVYLMPGHDSKGLSNDSYKTIINNAIHWVSKVK